MNTNKRGFTLVEVIVVLVILAILAAILIPSMIGWIKKAERKEAYVELHTVALAARSAYTELYASGHHDKYDQFLYAPGSDPSGLGALTASYLRDPALFANVTGIGMSGEFLSVRYKKNNVTYAYLDDGTVTITP